MGLYLQQKMFVRSPITDLSPSELELLLDQSLERIKSSHEERASSSNENLPEYKWNYSWKGSFLNNCKSVRGKISREKCLETPQIFVEKTGDGYSVKYNSQINERIAEKLAQLEKTKENEVSPFGEIFSKQFVKDRNWIIEQQVAIVKYLCDTQERYLQTQNLLDLKLINQANVAEHIGYSISSVSRLVKSLTMQFLRNRVIFADELIPGASMTTKRGVYMLEQLRGDPALYENRDWRVPDIKLVSILKEKFGVDVARRTVSKYRGILDSQK